MIGEIKNVVKRSAGRHVYYFGTISSDKVKIATFVPVIEESDTYLNQDTTNGYQRPGKKSRMNQLKRYLQDNPHRLIPPVILSARGAWKFSGDGLIGVLTLNGKAAIIDGQHRMGGIVAQYEEDGEPKLIDFICFADLSLEDEIYEFITINGEQRGVPKALNTYLKGDEFAELAWALNEDDDSPFKGKIFRTKGDQHTYFALHSIAKNIQRTFAHGAFKDLNFDDKLETLKRFWTSIAKHNADAWSDMKLAKREQKMKLAELTGNIAWSIVAPEILMKAWTPAAQEFNFDTLDKVIAFMSEDIDWTKDGEYRGLTGEVGGRRIATQLQSILAYYS